MAIRKWWLSGCRVSMALIMGRCPPFPQGQGDSAARGHAVFVEAPGADDLQHVDAVSKGLGEGVEGSGQAEDAQGCAVQHRGARGFQHLDLRSEEHTSE